MAEAKTKANDLSVQTFLDSIADEKRRKDSWAIHDLMQQLTGHPARMWGACIVGFGSYHYRYASGREGDSPLAGFSPRKQDLTLYIQSGFEQHAALMEKLGKYKTGKVCLYIKKLEDVDFATLKRLIKESADGLARSS